MALYVSPAERARLALAVQDLQRVQGKITRAENLRRKLLVEMEESPERKCEIEKEIATLEKIKEFFADQIARFTVKTWDNVVTLEDINDEEILIPIE